MTSSFSVASSGQLLNSELGGERWQLGGPSSHMLPVGWEGEAKQTHVLQRRECCRHGLRPQTLAKGVGTPEHEWMSGRRVECPRSTLSFPTEPVVGTDSQLWKDPFRIKGSPKFWAPEKLHQT